MRIFESLRTPSQGDKVEVKSPQFKNGMIHYFYHQVGTIYPDQLLFESDKRLPGDHNIHFQDIDDIKKAIVRYL